MSDVVIKAEGLGKKYIIGHQAERERYTALRDVLVRNARGVWHKTRDLLQGKPIIQGDTYEEVWALKDVDFEIRRGEAVGIIGRNGAGKSTLLKILSRITEPSAGRVTIRGRVASLLEVGTGFHPELTGRENIYLNGAILGMTRAEIKRKFDEIVDFAGVEQFLDTPVKRYSSGMYVRLAFAVAAHLEPEILVVDEVLAVGDAEFQKKCLGKMSDVASEGRTVLFVSHNMAAIKTLCDRALLLNSGMMEKDDRTDDVIYAYQSRVFNNNGQPEVCLRDWRERYGNGEAKIVHARLLDENHCPSTVVRRTRPVTLEFKFETGSPLKLHLAALIESEAGDKVLHISHFDSVSEPVHISQPGCYTAKFKLYELPLFSGRYTWTLGIHTPQTIPVDVVQNTLAFSVEEPADSPRPLVTRKPPAYVWTKSRFSIAHTSVNNDVPTDTLDVL